MTCRGTYARNLNGRIRNLRICGHHYKICCNIAEIPIPSSKHVALSGRIVRCSGRVTGIQFLSFQNRSIIILENNRKFCSGSRRNFNSNVTGINLRSIRKNNPQMVILINIAVYNTNTIFTVLTISAVFTILTINAILTGSAFVAFGFNSSVSITDPPVSIFDVRGLSFHTGITLDIGNLLSLFIVVKGNIKIAIVADAHLFNSDTIFTLFASNRANDLLAIIRESQFQHIIVGKLCFYDTNPIITNDTTQSDNFAISIGNNQFTLSINFRFRNANAIFTLDIAQIQHSTIGKLYRQLARLGNGNHFNTNTVDAVLTICAVDAIDTILAVGTIDTIFTIRANNPTQVDVGVVGEIQNQFAAVVNFRFRDADTIFAIDAILTVNTIYTVLTIRAVDTIFSISTNNLTQIVRSTIGESDYQFAGSINLRLGNANAIFAVSTVFTIGTINAIFAINTSNLTQVRKSTIGIRNAQFAGGIDFHLRNTNTILTIGTISTVCTILTSSSYNHTKDIGFTIGISNNKFPLSINLGLGNADTIRAIIAISTDNLTQVNAIAIRVHDGQFAIIVDRGRGNTHTIFTISTVFAIFAIGSLNITQIHRGAVGQNNLQFAILVNGDVLNTNTISTVFTVRAILTVRAIFTISTVFAVGAIFTGSPNNNAQIFHCAIGVSQNQFALGVDFRLTNANTILTIGSVFAINAVFAGCARCTNYVTQVGTLTIREGQNQFAFGVDLSSSNTNAILAVSAIHTILTIDAIRTVHAIFAISAYNLTQVSGRTVRISKDQLTSGIDYGICDTDTILPVNTVFAVSAVHAIFTGRTRYTVSTILAICTNHASQVGLLAVGISQNQLAIFIDLGFRDTNTIGTIHADNLIQIDGSSIGKSNDELSILIYRGAGNTYAIFTVGTIDAIFAISAVLTIGTIDAIFAISTVFSVGTNSFSYSYFRTIGQNDNQFALGRKLSSSDAYGRLRCRRINCSAPLILSSRITVIHSDLIGGLAIQRFQPFLNSSFVSVLNCQFISG